MKLSTTVNALNEKGESEEKELSIMVDGGTAYFELAGKDLFECDFQDTFTDFIEAIFKLWVPQPVEKKSE